MADIFISYSSEDQARVEPLAKALQDQEWAVFWDFTIPVGKTWRQVITEALDAAKCAVVVWSKSSIKSEWVQEEAEEAYGRSILIPVMIDKVKPPLGFRRMQAAKLIKWSGEPDNPEFEKLIESVETILGPSPVKAKMAEKKQSEEEAKRKADEEAKRIAEEERKLKQEEERKRKAEEDKRRKQQEDQERKAAEEKRRNDQELKRKAEEERLKNDAEAKRKAEEQRRQKEAEAEPERERKAQSKRKTEFLKPESKDAVSADAVIDDTKLTEPKPTEQTSIVKKPAKKSPTNQIGIAITLLVAIIVGAILLFRQEPIKPSPAISPPSVKQEQPVEIKPGVASSSTEFTNSIGMKFNLIPAGKFVMGSPPDEPGRGDNETQHEVRITKPFYLQTTEVFQGQWKEVMGYNPWDNPSYFKDCGDECPVEQVSWDDAQEFILKLNKLEGTSKYRLPTEAEWEYACRAETTTPFSTGDCISTYQANYNGSYHQINCRRGEYREKTIKVGSFQPNAWGLFDMHGNVSEWVQDRYGDYPLNSVIDPKGPEVGDYRVFRGGSWFNSPWGIRSARRISADPGGIVSDGGQLGFRVARDL